jgi:chromosome segregation ATPase
MALYDAQGQEIPGSMTADEVQAKIAESVEAVKAEAETAQQALQSELEEAKAQLEENTKAIATSGEKDKNLSSLRRLNDDLTKKIGELEGKIDQSVKGVTDMVTSKTRDNIISTLAQGDKDVEAKMKIQYERLIKLEEKVDDETIAKVAADAYRLSVDNPQPSVIGRVVQNKPSGGVATGDTTIDPQVLEAGAAFGLSAEDIKKYGGK